MENFGQITSFIWGVADLVRDTFKRGKYQDVILPLTVLRRLDCVLEPTKQQVLERFNELEGKLDNLDPQLRRASGHAFYNTSMFTFETLLQDSGNIAANLRAWINGFSENMREVLEKFDFDNTITKLDQAGLLFLVLERFKSIDLHPDKIDNFTMGSIFEELIRKFNEALNENPGEHFTPRDVIHLMVALMVDPDRDNLATGSVVRTVYDPCCGSGGMLTITRKVIREYNSDADIHLHGQEVNPETFAICKSDLFLTTKDGRDAENIAFGSTLSKDGHASSTFDYLITNPPYGKDWKMDQEAVKAEAAKGFGGRFGAGLPRISDGQLLFLQHMVAHMKPTDHGGSRVAIIMSGSPLFTGDAGSGESEIRRWLMEEDLVEAIVAVPEQMFYNTGIGTYVWLVTNRKAPERQGKVQLIDASRESFWRLMRRSLGDKRREISEQQAEEVLQIHRAYEEGSHSKIFATANFGYRKIRVDRPLRLTFQITPERVEQLKLEKAFQDLGVSKKKDPRGKAAEAAEGRRLRQAIEEMLRGMPSGKFASREDFERALKKAARQAELKLTPPIKKAIFSKFSERDVEAVICMDKNGNPEPDPQLRDYEKVPLNEAVETYFEREVTPHLPDAWIDTTYADDKDGQVGKVGYEINFTRHFYVYEPPRPLAEIDAEIQNLESELMELVREVVR